MPFCLGLVGIFSERNQSSLVGIDGVHNFSEKGGSKRTGWLWILEIGVGHCIKPNENQEHLCLSTFGKWNRFSPEQKRWEYMCGPSGMNGLRSRQKWSPVPLQTLNLHFSRSAIKCLAFEMIQEHPRSSQGTASLQWRFRLGAIVSEFQPSKTSRLLTKQLLVNPEKLGLRSEWVWG